MQATEARARTLVFDFFGNVSTKPKAKTVPKGQVTASGVIVYNDDDFFLETGVPMVMPVTGGSLGWYGATGQLTTVRLNAQGEHTQTLDITYSNHKSRKAGFL